MLITYDSSFGLGHIIIIFTPSKYCIFTNTIYSKLECQFCASIFVKSLLFRRQFHFFILYIIY